MSGNVSFQPGSVRKVASRNVLKLTFQKHKYRGPWLAAHYLQERGVKVPAPIAYIERGRLGLVTSTVMISQFLHGYGNVEHYCPSRRA